MELTDKPLNEQESLKIIEQMIARAKNDMHDNGVMYLLWGYLVLIAALSNYILQFIVEYKYFWLPWAILMPLGGLISMILGPRMNKKEKVKTYVSEFLGYVIIAFLAGLFVVLFFMPKLGLNCYPMVMLMYGIWLFISGGALKFKPLIIGGIINWVLAVAAFYVTFQYQLLIISAAVLLGYIIPGHLLNLQFRKNV